MTRHLGKRLRKWRRCVGAARRLPQNQVSFGQNILLVPAVMLSEIGVFDRIAVDVHARYKLVRLRAPGPAEESTQVRYYTATNGRRMTGKIAAGDAFAALGMSKRTPVRRYRPQVWDGEIVFRVKVDGEG